MKKAVIMAGGFGTRLRPLTTSIPKPMAPLMNVPMMEHIVNLLKLHNIGDVLSVLYYQPEIIKSHFGDGSNFGINMSYVQAMADYGTAGAVKNAAEHIGLQERFIIISGDVLTDFDISDALKFHIENKAKATILLTRVPNPLQFGIVMTDAEGRITRFLEKPSWGEVFSDTINTGIYILEPDVLDLIPFQREFDFSKDLYPLMLRENIPLYGYIAEGYWRDIGNLNEYQTACADILAGKVKVELKGTPITNGIIGEGTEIADDARILGKVVAGKNSTVGKGALLRDSVIGNNVTIGSGARVTGSVIWDNVVIGESASLTDDVICNDTIIGNDATIQENVFIAERCNIGSYAQLAPNIKLWPRKQVESGAILSRSLVQEEKWLRELFTEARISGQTNIEVNPEFAAKLGSAIGSALGSGVTVALSRDADAASRMTARAINAGLMSVGVSVGDLQLTSIPQTRQELRNGKYAAGIHIRRSVRYNDRTDIILFNGDGRDLPSSKAKTIERLFFGEDIRRVAFDKVGNISFPERSSEHYINRFIGSLDATGIASRKFHFLIDYSFGLASGIFPQILGQLQCGAVSMNSYIDLTRSYSDTNTTTEAEEVSSVMRSLGYPLGFKIDAAAERIAIVDEYGVWYPPQRLLSIVVKLFLEANKDKRPFSIAVPVIASAEIDILAAEYDVNVIRIKNSHSAMVEATTNKDVAFVGDSRGRFIFPDYLFASDAMFTIGKILEMMSLTGLSIADAHAAIPMRFKVQTSVACPWEAKGRVMRRAMEHTEREERQLIDGVKVFLGQDSVLLLPDKERASFFVFTEGETQAAAQSLSDEYAELIRRWSAE